MNASLTFESFPIRIHFVHLMAIHLSHHRKDGLTNTKVRLGGNCEKINADGARRRATVVLSTIECRQSILFAIERSKTTQTGRTVPIGTGTFMIITVVVDGNYPSSRVPRIALLILFSIPSFLWRAFLSQQDELPRRKL